MAPLKKTERERIGYQNVCMVAYLIAPAPLTLDYYRTQIWITVPLSVLTQILKVTISAIFNHEYEHLKCQFKLFLISLHEIHSLTLAHIVIHA